MQHFKLDSADKKASEEKTKKMDHVVKTNFGL